ncbi:AraC family transcriptional regulator [Pseudofulvibacter geojedonensis]|uniref:GyrI-like domain-containing protein n=1 Tax=Pseudofulvibacter geojedonensis TaxID=1123758 RepID=A0ABW3I471_9FLAO
MNITYSYIKRVNDVFTYIDNHLENDLSLNDLSRIAHFSPYHFHRIFKVIAHEPLQVYINRKRIEKAAGLLFRNQNLSISEIYLQCGFASAAAFNKVFKKFYAVSPSEFRKKNPNKYSKIGQVNNNKEQYLRNLEQLIRWRDMNSTIEIKQVSELHFATLTVIGSQNLQTAFPKLMGWAGPKGLLANPNFKMGTIFYDSFKVTPADKVRMKACLLVDNPIESENDIEVISLAPQKCIVGSFEIGIEEFEKTWTSLFMWMNVNEHKIADKQPFEIYHNNFNDHPEKKCRVDMYIPIQ